jgi:circadian clock protein KaiC
MTAPRSIERYATGVRNLDALLRGGLPKGTLTVLAGPPGSGKTILAQQIGFVAAAVGRRVLYFQTLSEPTAKTLQYLSTFSFFSAELLEKSVSFVDLGALLRGKGLEHAAAMMLDHVKRLQPALVVIDSFKVFDDLASSAEGLRKFSYELAVHLIAWECTSLLIGEYRPQDYESNPLFSITDGLIRLVQREASGEQQRFLQIVKMRGTEHHRDECPFAISEHGVEVFAPRVTIARNPHADTQPPAPRCKTGIARLDDLLGDGIPRGSSMLVGGVAGTGKTVLLLEFVYRGAIEHGEKSILFSFEETEERLRATARGLGWRLDDEIDAGRVAIVFIAQPEIMVEQHLLMMRERIEAMGARRVAIDSVSVFLHKVTDPLVVREKVFQLASVVQNVGAVALFSSDIPYGSERLSRSGVEETVVDGIVLLTSIAQGMHRRRYLEIYKLRNTAHLEGQHSFTIGAGGIHVFPRSGTDAPFGEAPPAVDPTRRLSTGVRKLDEVLGGGLLDRSVTLVSGSTGIGKSTLAMQFVVGGAANGEPALYIAVEESPAQLLASADALALPLREAVASGRVELVFLGREGARDARLVATLTEKVVARRVRRLVLDGASQLLDEPTAGDPLSQLLSDLVLRLKTLGVTSLITLESKALYSTDHVTDGGLSPVADNLIMLRYVARGGALESTLMAVKSRGSAHDGARYTITISRGGVRLGERAGGSPERRP